MDHPGTSSDGMWHEQQDAVAVVFYVRKEGEGDYLDGELVHMPHVESIKQRIRLQGNDVLAVVRDLSAEQALQAISHYSGPKNLSRKETQRNLINATGGSIL